MPTTPEFRTLAQAVDEPHDQALAAFDVRDGDPLAGVAWLATHLAAVERVLYPAAVAVLPDSRRHVRDQRRCDHRLQAALWRLDRRLSGDANTATEPVDGLEDAVREALRQHAACEHGLTAQIERRLGVDAQRLLVQRLDDAMLMAPTRPHPYTPHPRLAGGLLFRADALVDRWRDLMDNRRVATPHRERPLRKMNRWAAYLMAAPYPPPDRRLVGEAPEPPRNTGADLR